MSANGDKPELRIPLPREGECKLAEIPEAVSEGRRVENLGTVACLLCGGIYDVRHEAGQQPSVENIVFIPCMLGYSNNPAAHLDG